jgi:hypothetical protein
LLGLLAGVLLLSFLKSLSPHQVLFDNDSSLGALKAEWSRLPGRFTGAWRNLGWIGAQAASASPKITMVLATLLPPVAFLKIYAPFTLLFLGFCAFVFFRQLKFSPTVCVLGGIAAGLNPHFLSIACWGQGNWNIAAGCAFLAMAAFHAKSISKIWQRALLAGMAVGMVVMEGFDVGAILSVYIGVFVIFHLLNSDGPVPRRLLNALLAETIVVLFAAIIAAHTMLTLVQTQVQHVAEMGQGDQTRQSRWWTATQWSLPKVETLQVFVPCLFGCHLNYNIVQHDRSSAYWGSIGREIRLDQLGSDDASVRSNAVSALELPDSLLQSLNTPDRRSRTTAMAGIASRCGLVWRYVGSGECAGTIVSLLALFGLANFLRREGPLSDSERSAVGSWGAVALISLLAAWGRFGFIYPLFYKLPYFSTIRNPVKFMHPFHIAWIILAAYGMEVLYRRYMRARPSSTGLLPHHLLEWWARATGFDRRWTIFMLLLAATSVLAAGCFYANRNAFIRYLQDQAFTDSGSPTPTQISNYCFHQVALFLVFLAAGMLAVAAILSAAWNSSRIQWAWVFLGALLLCDLARADLPWVRYYDYLERYAPDSLTSFLAEKPWEHRVIGRFEPLGIGSKAALPFGQLYWFWLENQFPYHNIQSLDFTQWPHIPDLDRTYLEAFQLAGRDPVATDFRPAIRLWQLSNTRYFLSALAWYPSLETNSSGIVTNTISTMDFLNQRGDPAHKSFRQLALFNLVLKPGAEPLQSVGDYTVEPNNHGTIALIEYPRALPRASLYANWQTPSNNQATLNLLASPDFEPLDTVLVATNSSLPRPESRSTANAGVVSITDYHPKYVRLDATAATPAVLLLNDRINPDWKAWIDGVPAPVLRCNYIMRGVYLTQGRHIVEFRFRPSLIPLCLSLGGLLLGSILAASLLLTRHPASATPPTQ